MKIIELNDDEVRAMTLRQLGIQPDTKHLLMQAGVRTVGQLMDMGPKFLKLCVGLTQQQLDEVEYLLAGWNLEMEEPIMQFAELCLNDKYSLMFDNLNSFPFGMGISLLDEDGEEINKYIYDLRGNPLDEVREALNKFHIGNDPWGGIRLSESEIARVSKFIIMQAQQCEEEWLRTFEMEI